MRNSLTPMPQFSQLLKSLAKFQPLALARFVFPGLGLAIGLATVLDSSLVRAESPETAPSQLKNTLAQIDTAATRNDVKAVLQFYSPNFTHSDGLSPQSLEQILTQLWQRYPQMSYRTEIKSWQNDGTGFVAETVTYITGTQSMDGREIKLESTLRSRQRIDGGKIVRQEILAERTQLTSGKKPPTLEVILPEQVRIGQDYNFDAIVQEPLGNNFLIGTALEEPVKIESYLKPTKLKMDSLPAGGLFKLGRAPLKEGNYWISAVVMRSDGMTMVTQRLQVIDPSRPPSSSN